MNDEKDDDLKIEFAPEVLARMEADPKLAEAVRNMTAAMRQARAGVQSGQYKSMEDGIEALTGNRPEAIDRETGEVIEGASMDAEIDQVDIVSHEIMDEKAKITIVGDTGAGFASMIASMAGEGFEPAKMRDNVALEPQVDGKHGRAWLADDAAALRALGKNADQHGGIATWIVEAPWAHPAWHSYLVIALHLRSMPEHETAIYREGATHEILVFALNPDCNREKLIECPILDGALLLPANFAGQFIEVSDDLARERIKKTVQQICDGVLSPDTDWTREWVKRFGDYMLKDRVPPITPVIRR